MRRRVFGVSLLVVILFLVGEIAPKEALGWSTPANSVGWDGSGLGCANVTYHFGPLTNNNGLTDSQVKAEVVRAMQAWSQVACVHFTETSTVNLSNSIDIEWDNGPGGFPFPNNVISLGYYPPPNQGETLAGNIYFNNAYTWCIGCDANSGYDIFSVALHELGRALGLDTSADSTAAMYLDYHGPLNGLAQDDIDGIQSLYAPGPASPPTPLPSPHEVGIYRNGTWYLDLTGNGHFDSCVSTSKCLSWGGNQGDVPVVGDWTGDGKTKVGIYRNGTWYLDLTGNGHFDSCVSSSKCLAWGGDPADKVVVGQW
jgi:hypothetical protein